MQKARFPKRKYLRQMHELYNELGSWRELYGVAVHAHPDDWFGSKCEDRMAVLEHAQHQVHHVIETIETMPRLS